MIDLWAANTGLIDVRLSSVRIECTGEQGSLNAQEMTCNNVLPYQNKKKTTFLYRCLITMNKCVFGGFFPQSCWCISKLSVL